MVQRTDDPKQLVPWTVRISAGMRQIIRNDIGRRKGVANPNLCESDVAREALAEWAEKRGYLKGEGET